MKRSSLGISPVVATVILVAIAIVIAIAVAFWASGLVGVFTRFEKLELTSVFATPTGGNQYTVTINAKNTGSSSATIDAILINGVQAFTIADTSCTSTGNAIPGITNTGTCAITSGSPALTPGSTVTITITGLQPSSPGITIEVSVHTASGKTYPSSVLLP